MTSGPVGREGCSRPGFFACCSFDKRPLASLAIVGSLVLQPECLITALRCAVPTAKLRLACRSRATLPWGQSGWEIFGERCVRRELFKSCLWPALCGDWLPQRGKTEGAANYQAEPNAEARKRPDEVWLFSGTTTPPFWRWQKQAQSSKRTQRTSIKEKEGATGVVRSGWKHS